MRPWGGEPNAISGRTQPDAIWGSHKTRCCGGLHLRLHTSCFLCLFSLSIDTYSEYSPASHMYTGGSCMTETRSMSPYRNILAWQSCAQEYARIAPRRDSLELKNTPEMLASQSCAQEYGSCTAPNRFSASVRVWNSNRDQPKCGLGCQDWQSGYLFRRHKRHSQRPGCPRD